MCSFSLSFFIIFGLLNVVDSRSKTDGLIKISSCSLPLKSCSRLVETRTLCMNHFHGCAQDTQYLCGIDVTGNFIIEQCQPEYECEPGTTLQFEVDPATREVILKCLPCPEGWFEPEPIKSSSSSRLPGCTYRHKPSALISSNLVLLSKGTKAAATEWFCDYRRGFYERNGKMLCDDIPTQPCHCINNKTCQDGQLLRPDGLCVRCRTQLIPDNGFRCDNQLSKTMLPTTVRNIEATNAIASATSTVHLRQEPLHSLQESETTSDGYDSGSEAGEHNSGLWSLLVAVMVCVIPVVIFALYRAIYCFYDIYKQMRQRAFTYTCDNTVDDPENPTKHFPDEVGEKAENPTQNGNCNYGIKDCQNCQMGDNNFQDNSRTEDNSKTVNNVQYTCNIGTVIINGSVFQNGHVASPPASDSESPSKPQDEADSRVPNQEMDTLKSFHGQEKESLTEDVMMDYLTASPLVQGDPNADETKRKQPF